MKREYNFTWFIFVGDGEPNCVDDSDEIGCPQGVCSFGVCSQICLEKKSKVKDNFNCRCANGYVKGPEKNDTCVSFEEPLLLIASDTDLRFILPLKQMDSEVHGLIPISKNKIDVFDVRILPDTIFLYYISVPNRTIQKLTTTAFSSNFKRKSKRATTSAEQEPITIVSWVRSQIIFETAFWLLHQNHLKPYHLQMLHFWFRFSTIFRSLRSKIPSP